MSSIKQPQPPSALATGQPNAERRTRLLALVVLVGTALYVLLDIIVQLLPPHYNALSQPESDLAVGPFGFLMAINFVVRGLIAFALIWALATYFPREVLSRVGLVLVGIWGGGAVLLAFFPTDLAGAHPTLHGAIHLVVALLAFFCGAIGEFLLSLRLLSISGRRAVGLATLIIAVLAFLEAVQMVVLLGHPLGGLIERIFIGLVLLWMVVIAVPLYTSHADATGTEASVSSPT